MSEVEQECYVPGCQSCSQVVRGYEAVAKHMQRAGTILDDQALAATNGVLENLKRHRDLLISFKVNNKMDSCFSPFHLIYTYTHIHTYTHTHIYIYIYIYINTYNTNVIILFSWEPAISTHFCMILFF